MSNNQWTKPVWVYKVSEGWNLHISVDKVLYLRKNRYFNYCQVLRGNKAGERQIRRGEKECLTDWLISNVINLIKATKKNPKGYLVWCSPLRRKGMKAYPPSGFLNWSNWRENACKRHTWCELKVESIGSDLYITQYTKQFWHLNILNLVFINILKNCEQVNLISTQM